MGKVANADATFTLGLREPVERWDKGGVTSHPNLSARNPREENMMGINDASQPRKIPVSSRSVLLKL